MTEKNEIDLGTVDESEIGSDGQPLKSDKLVREAEIEIRSEEKLKEHKKIHQEAVRRADIRRKEIAEAQKKTAEENLENKKVIEGRLTQLDVIKFLPNYKCDCGKELDVFLTPKNDGFVLFSVCPKCAVEPEQGLKFQSSKAVNSKLFYCEIKKMDMMPLRNIALLTQKDLAFFKARA